MGEPFNGLTPAEAERLAILIEECNEVGQIACKILRHGYASTHPNGGPDNRALLGKEIGDVYAAVQMMSNHIDIDPQLVNDATQAKLDNVRRYLHHTKVSP